MFPKKHVFVVSIAAACGLTSLGCSASNEPATTPGGGAGSAPVGAAGAPVSAAGAPSGGGGAPSSAGDAPAVAGAPSTSGGAPAAAGAGTGGAPASGGASTGGASASGGASSGGASASGGASGMFAPLCSAVPVTAAGTAPAKGGACTDADTQLCWKTCGPKSSGYKSETCTTGVYQEQSGCTFPATGDYSCFKIPTTLDATCPTTTIVANTACTVAACVTCTDSATSYYDTSNNLKKGYCTCPAPGAAGTSKWSCASDTSWPCPTGTGC